VFQESQFWIENFSTSCENHKADSIFPQLWAEPFSWWSCWEKNVLQKKKKKERKKEKKKGSFDTLSVQSTDIPQELLINVHRNFHLLKYVTN